MGCFRRRLLVASIAMGLAACSHEVPGAGGRVDTGRGPGTGDSGTRGRDGGALDVNPFGEDTGPIPSGPDTGVGTMVVDAGPNASGPDGGGCGCGPVEICGNGIDDNCNGLVDEGCPCSPGRTQQCYAGCPNQAGVGVCTWGTQRCSSLAEFVGEWGPCLGAGHPEPTMCGGHMDYHCNGTIEEGCDCTLGQSRGCYDGPAGTRMIGQCHDGMQMCVGTATTTHWNACVGQTLPAPSSCDGVDRMCTGDPTAGCACTLGMNRSCYSGPAGTSGVGLCRAGTQSCVVSGGTTAWGPCVGEVLPTANTCDGVDRLCTGDPNAGCACRIGDNRTCYGGPAGTAGVGLCRAGTQSCINSGGMAAWGPCIGEVRPSANTCDAVDRMCNGMPLAGCTCTVGTNRGCYSGPAGTAGVGVCHGGRQDCVAAPGGSAWGPCTGEVVPSASTCDGIDRMCNNMPYAGCTCTPGQTRPCYEGPPGTRGVGICHDGMQTCVRMGMGVGWSTDCAGQQLPLAMSMCTGRDDRCTGRIDEGCGPRITCPADVTTPAGTPIRLTATAVSPGRTIASYNWTITQAPTGGIGTMNQWSPDPPNQAAETFLAYIVGTYTIQVTAIDSAGAPVSCETHVTAQGHGLRVQLTWDGTGDLDLHLHDAVTTPWFTRSNHHDCFYADRTPTWGGGGANPALDFDNVTGFGPENTRIDLPVVGMSYTIAIHNYARGQGRRATVDVFCGGVTSASQTFVSRAMNGGSAGDCTNNDFWRVARVVFTSPTTCTITPIDTYTRSTQACGAF